MNVAIVLLSKNFFLFRNSFICLVVGAFNLAFFYLWYTNHIFKITPQKFSFLVNIEEINLTLSESIETVTASTTIESSTSTITIPTTTLSYNGISIVASLGNGRLGNQVRKSSWNFWCTEITTLVLVKFCGLCEKHVN